MPPTLTSSLFWRLNEHQPATMSVLARLQALLRRLGALAGRDDETASEALLQEARSLAEESSALEEAELPAVR